MSSVRDSRNRDDDIPIVVLDDRDSKANKVFMNTGLTFKGAIDERYSL